MPLSIGEMVVIRSLRNKRGEVIAVDRNGRYQLRVEGVTIRCREEDLSPLEAPRKRKKDARDRPTKPKDAAAVRPGAGEAVVSPGRVDLHGLVVDEALLRLVDEINRSLLRGADRIEVVHGKGSGRVRDAVHRHLSSMPVVAAFRLDSKNAGVTWAHFR